MGDKATFLNIISVDGKGSDQLEMPKEIFSQEINKELLAQALRVYSFNRRQGTAQVKTRAAVTGSRRKIWRQKGTGRARHGDRYAPIFVGGGVAHGPISRDWSLKLSKEMRKKALFCALSLKLIQKNIFLVEGIDKIDPKTRVYNLFFQEKIDFNPTKESLLLVVGEPNEKVWRAVRNIKNLGMAEVKLLNAYDLMLFDKIIFSKEAIPQLIKVFLPKLTVVSVKTSSTSRPAKTSPRKKTQVRKKTSGTSLRRKETAKE